MPFFHHLADGRPPGLYICSCQYGVSFWDEKWQRLMRSPRSAIYLHQAVVAAAFFKARAFFFIFFGRFSQDKTACMSEALMFNRHQRHLREEILPRLQCGVCSLGFLE
jgi:hypothetical protein